jgi:hypothetical protein
VPEQIDVGISKNVWITSVSYVAWRFRKNCDEDRLPTYRQVVGMSALPGRGDAPTAYPRLKSCALHRDTEIVTLSQYINEARNG